jgi:hypothetical protein
MLVLLIKYAIEMVSYAMMYLPSSMKIGIGIQAILRVCCRNLKLKFVGIIDGEFFYYVEVG